VGQLMGLWGSCEFEPVGRVALRGRTVALEDDRLILV
jgi:hypothetical protein